MKSIHIEVSAEKFTKKERFEQMVGVDGFSDAFKNGTLYLTDEGKKLLGMERYEQKRRRRRRRKQAV
ncbi:hypothetical protein IMZ31_19155 (plasmid) [Pontibacillus sp. ALD_SL1]|uniref:hypothetical protein n=1 Tax=Pontibacillus sp. ALD_SL1 TaxID=2777185 RepID=UPI001A9717B6|nr:hypothetical protein [Pontibacillus sp. ALD_SL1]QST02669.1 hypothetical protein IMZ31_19155 [Pontibacillus sp. ALD_SL1]